MRGLLACAAAVVWTTALAAQPPAGQAPSAGPGGGRGRGVISSPRDAYPERPPADLAAVERGRALYSVNCAFCHGADTRGGDSGPSLLRSGIVLDDQRGELIGPIVRSGRPDRGMPKFAFNNEQTADIAAFIHTFRAAGYDESRRTPPSIVVGDVQAGQAFFNARCASCHSTSGDLRGLASRIDDAKLLQQTWLMPGSGRGRGGAPPVVPPAPTATVSLASGERVEGRIERIDDFTVSLVLPDGSRRSFETDRSGVKVDVRDPLQPHRELLRVYSDKDIHDVTAFLVTLK